MTTTDTDPILLRLAGEPAVRAPSGEWTALGAREGVLLAWLAIEGPTSRHALAVLLWPDSSPEAARSALRQRLFRLRRVAGTTLVTGAHTLSLAAGVGHDLEAATTVLGGRGRGLGVGVDDWLARQNAERLSRIRASIVERGDRAEAAGDLGAAMGHARGWLALEPLSEAAHRRVMLLHYLAGERPAALLAFDHCEQVLKDEVGIAPSPETLALLQTITRADAELAAKRGVAFPASVPASVLRPPRRVGHADAWHLLCGSRPPRTARIMFGEAGIGKSRLLADLAAGRSSPPDVAMVSARPGDAGVPHALAARTLRAVAAGFGVGPAPGERSLLARLVPEFGAAALSVGGDPARLAHAARALVDAAVARGLATVIVDDLHFADDASVDLLQAVAADAACDWIFAMRPAELSPPARQWIDALQAAHGNETTTLQPLAPVEVEALLESLSIARFDAARDRAAVAALHRHTGGNPLYVLETVKAMLAAPRGEQATTRWPVAANVVRLIQQRLGRLSPLALRVARCAAIAGQDTEARLVADVLGLRPLDIADAWSELEAANVLRGVHFAHDLIAEAALASVPTPVAAPLHGDVAEWLEARHGEPARIADHWLAAGAPLKAAPALSEAGRRAAAAWRPEEAAGRHEHAGSIFRDAGDRRSAFRAFFLAAAAVSEVSFGERFAALRQILLELADDEGQQAMVAMTSVALLLEARQLVEARAAAQAGAAQAARAGIPDIEAEHLYMLAVIGWESGEMVEGVRCSERALQLLDGVPLEQRILRSGETEMACRFGLALMHATLGRYDDGVALLEDARRRALHLDDLGNVRDVDRALTRIALDRGDLARALAASGSALTLLPQTAHRPLDRARTMTARADALVLHGDLGAALDLYQGAAALSAGSAMRFFMAPIQLARLHHALGRRDLAKQGLCALRGRPEFQAERERAFLESALMSIGEAGDAAFVIDQASGIRDLPARVAVLCSAQPGCDAARLLPLLNLSLATAREHGAHGLWLALQVCRVAALTVADRSAEAGEAAEAAWRRIEAGVCGRETLPEMVAVLAPALAASRPALAHAAVARAAAWMTHAAATLAPAWRDNYLARAPARAGLLTGRPRLDAT